MWLIITFWVNLYNFLLYSLVYTLLKESRYKKPSLIYQYKKIPKNLARIKLIIGVEKVFLWMLLGHAL